MCFLQRAGVSLISQVFLPHAHTANTCTCKRVVLMWGGSTKTNTDQHYPIISSRDAPTNWSPNIVSQHKHRCINTRRDSPFQQIYKLRATLAKRHLRVAGAAVEFKTCFKVISHTRQVKNSKTYLQFVGGCVGGSCAHECELNGRDVKECACNLSVSS